MQGSRLTLRHFVPLVGFVVPTVIMGYGVIIPASCIAGVNELTVGFAGSIVGACVTYWVGLRALLRERAAADEG
jgi:hypothetical protein